MKLTIYFFLIILLSGLASFTTKKQEIDSRHALIYHDLFGAELDIQEGDIIFQASNSSQCKAIQLATKSLYSHCGIIFKENGKWVVYEAVQPVKITPLERWIKRGDNNHFVTKRLKDTSGLSSEVIQKMRQIGKQQLGKDYDLTFEWNDNRIYCSELVWKIYKRALDIEVGKLRVLKDFDLSSPIVKEIMKERYGTKIPYNETVISPADIFKSDLLVEVLNQ